MGSFQFLGGMLDGIDDVRVSGATAKVPFQPVRDLLAGGIWILLQQLHARQDHSRRAITTLQRVAFPKPFLNRMQFRVAGQAFDRRDVATVSLNGQDRARLDRFAVEQDRASAADARLASDVRPGQAATVAQEVHQQGAGIDFMLLERTIDADRDARFHRGCFTNCILRG